MMTAESSLEVAASPQRVWDYLAQFERWPEWIEINPRLRVTMALLPSEQIGMGAGRKISYSDSDKVAREYTLKEWLPPQVLAIEAPLPRESTFRLELEPKTTGTLVKLRVGFEAPEGPMMSLFASFFGFQKGAEVTVEEILKRLKAIVEASPEA